MSQARASKTGRRYGAVSARIRCAVRRLGVVTWRDVASGPAERDTVRRMLHLLRARGELRLVKRGSTGCRAVPAVFERQGNDEAMTQPPRSDGGRRKDQ